MSSIIKVSLPQYGCGTFYLHKIDGSYFQSLQQLIYYIMVDVGIYNELLTKDQLKVLHKLIKKDPRSIYKMNEDDKDYSEEIYELIQTLEYESCAYVGYRLDKKGYILNEDFIDQYPEKNLNKKYLNETISKIAFDKKDQKDKYIKSIFIVLDKILQKLIDQNSNDSISLEQVLNEISQKGRDLNFMTEIPKKYFNNVEVLLAAIKNNCSIGELPKGALDIKEIVMFLLSNNLLSSNLEFLSDSFKDDKEIAEQALKNNGSNIKYFSENIKNDYEIAKIAVEKDGTYISYVSEELKKNREFVKIALKQNGYAFMDVSDYYADDREMLLFALKNLGTIYSYMLQNDEYVGLICFASDRLKDDEEIVIEASKEDMKAFQYASKRLKSDKSFIFKLLSEISKYSKNNPEYDELDYFIDFIFKTIDKTYKTDKDFFLKLVKIDGQLLKKASSKLKNDLEIGIEAIKNDPNAVDFLSETIKNHKEIISLLKDSKLNSEKNSDSETNESKQIILEMLYEFEESYFKDASAELKDDYDFVKQVLKMSAEQIEFVSDRLKDNPEIAKLAVRSNEYLFQFISVRLKNDREFVKNLISKNGYILNWLEANLRLDKELILLGLNNLISNEKRIFKKLKIHAKLLKDPEVIQLLNKLN